MGSWRTRTSGYLQQTLIIETWEAVYAEAVAEQEVKLVRNGLSLSQSVIKADDVYHRMYERADVALQNDS